MKAVIQKSPRGPGALRRFFSPATDKNNSRNLYVTKSISPKTYVNFQFSGQNKYDKIHLSIIYKKITYWIFKQKCAESVTQPPENLPTSFRTVVRIYFIFNSFYHEIKGFLQQIYCYPPLNSICYFFAPHFLLSTHLSQNRRFFFATNFLTPAC